MPKPADYDEYTNPSGIIFWIPQQVALADIPFALQTFAESIVKDNLYDGTTFYVQVDGSTPMQGDLDLNGFSLLNVNDVDSVSGTFTGSVAIIGDVTQGSSKVNNTVASDVAKVRNIIHSVNAPTEQDGQNGDVWIQYEV